MREILRKTVGKSTATDGWLDATARPLRVSPARASSSSSSTKPTGWSWEAGYWAKISIETE